MSLKDIPVRLYCVQCRKFSFNSLNLGVCETRGHQIIKLWEKSDVEAEIKKKYISKEAVETFLSRSKMFSSHPGLVAKLCTEFELDFEKIRDGWRELLK